MCYAAAAAKSLQLCPTLCDPIDGSPPGSVIPGILQARTLEWVAISFSKAWKWKWSRSVVSDSSRPHGLQPTRLPHPWVFPGKSTGVGCHCLLWSFNFTQRQFIGNLSYIWRRQLDGGAWWASIYGVAQSWTWLKWLSSSYIYKILLLFNVA